MTHVADRAGQQSRRFRSQRRGGHRPNLRDPAAPWRPTQFVSCASSECPDYFMPREAADVGEGNVSGRSSRRDDTGRRLTWARQM